MTDRDEFVRTPEDPRSATPGPATPGPGTRRSATPRPGSAGGEGPGGPATSRRALLLGVGAVGAVGVLAACGDGSTPTPAGPGVAGPPPTTEAPPVIKVADIPVGGGKIYPTVKVVVTQPKAGEFKAFDATCQHAGCVVADIKDGVIICPCHGSTYNLADGSVHNGPTTKPLPPKSATVTGDTITVR